MNILRFFYCTAIAAVISITAGCAAVAPSPSFNRPPTVSTEQVVERSYTIGKEEFAFVGGKIARVADYILQKTTRQGSIHASQDFTLFYPLLGPTVQVSSAEVIPIIGTTERDGMPYRLISLTRMPFIKLLITEDGRLQGSALGLGDARMGFTYATSPPNVIFKPDTSTSAISAAGYVNFELIYSGVTKDSIRLLYREYTQDNLVRPAFSQDLVYERDSSTIRFRNILVKVLQANGEQIRFAVIEDGYPNQK